MAGGSAALALREQGYDGELTIIGEEVHRPYERPPLSKAILLGDAEEPDWVGDADFWTKLGQSADRHYRDHDRPRTQDRHRPAARSTPTTSS